MALICTVAASHFDVSTDINLSEPKNISKATDGAQKLYKMVCDTVGKNVPVMVVKPEYVLTTDAQFSLFLMAKVNLMITSGWYLQSLCQSLQQDQRIS